MVVDGQNFAIEFLVMMEPSTTSLTCEIEKTYVIMNSLTPGVPAKGTLMVKLHNRKEDEIQENVYEHISVIVTRRRWGSGGGRKG